MKTVVYTVTDALRGHPDPQVAPVPVTLLQISPTETGLGRYVTAGGVLFVDSETADFAFARPGYVTPDTFAAIAEAFNYAFPATPTAGLR